MPPLNHCAGQECCPERKSHKPPPCKCGGLRLAQETDGEMDGHAARKQADGEQDRHTEHLLWVWSAEALAQIKEVGDNKDAENCSLGGNEGSTFPAAPARKVPIGVQVQIR